MRKQSITNRKYLERLEKEDPDHLAEIKYRKYFSSAKTFIKKHGRPPELEELRTLIDNKLKGSE